jgi:predicted enzyme related to lactoylglutathione lyase
VAIASEPVENRQGRRAVENHHAIDYIEFKVKNLSESKRFYGAAFDWKFNGYGPEYAGIQGAGKEVGGLAQSTEVEPGGPLVVLFSEDLAASLAAVRAAGGQISREPFEFPGGRRFHFTDPSGNELGVWSKV